MAVVTCPSCGRRNRVRPHPTAAARCANCKAPLPWLVNEAPGPAAGRRVMSIPTLLVIRDGEEVDRVVGALPERQLEERLAAHLSARQG